MWEPDVPLNFQIGTNGWQTHEQLRDGYGTPVNKLHVQAWALWSRSTDGTYDLNENGGQVEDSSQLPFSKTRPFLNDGKGLRPADTKAYSSRLYKLIKSCMQLEPTDRPDLERLGATADSVLQSPNTSRFPGIRTTEEDDLPVNMRLDLGRETWSLGLGDSLPGKRHQSSEGLSD
jgi:hypothetical protein